MVIKAKKLNSEVFIEQNVESCSKTIYVKSMIPKTIHYCWFGRGEKSDLTKNCIESWKKYLPDYKIVEWNEDNFDVESNSFAKQAYECKKYAFVADYVRLKTLYAEGGIYMDTDVEILGSLDELLYNEAFIGFESKDLLSTGLIAAKKESNWIFDLLTYYNNRAFILENGSYDMIPNTQLVTNYMKIKGLVLNGMYQNICDLVTIYPQEYFSPKSPKTGRINILEKTLAVHHFAGSWTTKSEKFNSWLASKLPESLSEKVINFSHSIKKLYKK